MRLVGLLQRYCGPIEASLAHYYPGMDLATEWRSRRWRKLLNLIDWLPRNSPYIEAVANDDEVAASLVDEPSGSGPRMSEWSPEREATVDAVDRLGNVLQAIVAVAGVKPPSVTRMPRPDTAFDRELRRRRQQRHLDLVAMVLPPT
jgi:hypothetical protein